MRITRGKIKSEWIDNSRVRVKAVCKKCNNGWMSDIEGENKPHMFAMMNDKRTVLEPVAQKLLTRWAILKAMVIDGSSPVKRTPFYSECERTNMRPPLRALPIGTLVWLGRIPVRSLHVGLGDTFGEISNVPKAFHNCITTIVVGHLVIQVLTMHVLPMFATTRIKPICKPGAWDVNLLDIWPAFGNKTWPPAFSLILKGPPWEHHVGGLITRWSIGEDITK